MADRGWFSADMHVHRPLATLAVLMESEDLAVAVPLTRWRRTRPDVSEDPDLRYYLEHADQEGVFHAAGYRFFPVLNEELEPNDAALLASWLSRTAVPLEYPLASFGQAVQSAGGVSDSEKATSLELPALAALGACQTVGLVNNHLWRTGSFAGAWGAWPERMLGEYPGTCSGFVRAGFEMYSALLNAGFPIKPSAGSASGVHPVPPGWSRIYVRTGGPLTAHAWSEGLRAGRSFVTSGPMLFLNVNGKQPGEEVRGQRFPLTLDIMVEVASISPISSAEVVMNGAAHVVTLAPDHGKPYTWRGSLKLVAKSSSWIAARWTAERGNSCDAAHTAPVYVRNGEDPIPVNRREVQTLLRRVNSLIEQVTSSNNSGIVADSDTVREKTLSNFRKAAEIYQRKLAGTAPDKE
jgi:hypothetical protein